MTSVSRTVVLALLSIVFSLVYLSTAFTVQKHSSRPSYQYKSLTSSRRISSKLMAGVPAAPPKERGPPKKKPKEDVIQVETRRKILLHGGKKKL